MVIGDMKVSLNLADGIHLLGCDGGMGKTYLYTLLGTCTQMPEYKDVFLLLKGSSLESESYYLDKINQFNGAIIMIDRFDLIMSDNIISALESKSNTAILLDFKHYACPLNFCVKFCNFKRISPYEIEVSVI